MTALLPFFVASSELVAVIVIVFGVGRLAGAVYIPFASIVPLLALPPAIEFTDQFTVAVGLLLTTAANDSFEPARIVTVAGVTVTPELAPSGNAGEPSLPRRVPSPEQPLNNNNRIAAGALQIRFTDRSPIELDDRHFIARPQPCDAAFAFQFNFYQGVGRCCLGTVRLRASCGTGYWPRGQNEFNGLSFLDSVAGSRGNTGRFDRYQGAPQ